MPTSSRRWSLPVRSTPRWSFFRASVLMFRPRPDAPPASVAVIVEGRTILVPVGASAAAAVLIAGFRSIRETPDAGVDRAPYCLMGACYDCLPEIDAVPNPQS